ncbi:MULTISPECIES: alpha/beta fold hydrolase [unclassified Novosphingobium]|uniref:alpha/beta fold hydrolase n=1 Tax=unclassified Novosphingobium TaxID=2644732 RepID=UPI00135BA134|nr:MULTISPECIES: alpha/beta hydrolase [unclassified Novosphingobium]
MVAVGLLAAAAAGCIGFVAAARAGWLSRDDAAVLAHRETPGSRFLTVKGVRIHYLDEGAGPPVLLLHGSYLDVHAYDAWARVLARDHRVVRLDRPAFGLTGHDPHSAAGYEREAEVVSAFADVLGIRGAVLVGASSGGTTAARIAARRPDLVSRLVLINFPLARRYIKPERAYALSIWLRDEVLLNYQPAWLTRWMLNQNLTDNAAASPEMVARLTDEANRPGVLEDRRRLEAGAHGYTQAEREADLAAIHMPSLLIWGRDNPLLTVKSGQDAFARVGAAQKRMAVIDHASHMVPVEKSAESLALVRQFLSETAAH